MSEAPADKEPRKVRTSSRRSPLLKGRIRGKWYPDLVGKIRGYPKTQEKHDARVALMRQQIKLYNAEGITGRSGIPDGWAGKKKLINAINAAALAEAKELVADMKAKEHFTPDNIESEIVLTEAIKMVVAEKHTPENEPVPLYSPQVRLAAMKLVVEYTQRKPTTTAVVAEGRAEDFLTNLANKVG